MSDSEIVNKALDAQIDEVEHQIAEIEDQAREAPAPSNDEIDFVPDQHAEEVAQEWSWSESAADSDYLDLAPDEIDRETLEAMWQTCSAYTEQYLTRELGHDPTDHQRRRWAQLERGFLSRPRFFRVADCEQCVWVQGGWLNAAEADRALSHHYGRGHLKST